MGALGVTLSAEELKELEAAVPPEQVRVGCRVDVSVQDRASSPKC